MSIQRFRGATLEEALVQAEASLGQDPLILWQERDLKTWYGQTYCEVLAARRDSVNDSEPRAFSNSNLKRVTAPWLSPFDLRETPAWVFCGLNGAGKTTAIVKLAAALKRSGIAPLLVSRDDRKLSGFAELANFSKALDVDFTIDKRVRPREKKFILVDTPGFESIALDALMKIWREIPHSKSVLVIDGTQKMATILKSLEAVAPERWDAFVVTRWDLNEDWELVEQIHRMTSATLLGISQSPRLDVPFLTRDLSMATEPSPLSQEVTV